MNILHHISTLFRSVRNPEFRSVNTIVCDKFFAHNTVGRNRKGCSLRYFDIIVDFCDNLYLIVCHINFFNRAYLHACIAHNMPRHQSAYLRIVNAQLIAFFAKAESTHKGNNAGQHHCAA